LPAGDGAPRRFFIHTFGCQMNESDSDRMAELLARDGWVRTGAPEDADLVLVNTCAVREKAGQKMFSVLGRYRILRASRGTRIGVAGCIAQQEREHLLSRVPYLDFVLGPDRIAALPEAVARAVGGRRSSETAWMDSAEYVFPRADPEAQRGRVCAFVTVMKGCDNVCSFCIVPRVRGREVSRPRDEVIAEIRVLAAAGVREVTLIGQNVNSYAGGATFAQLVREAAAVPGVARLRFTTSHPRDLSDDLMRCFAEVANLMPHLHLPVQSGSDAVLARMRRDYTAAQYLDKVDRLRALAPGLALTSDVIAGFPGESDEDFEATMRLVERVRFENLYSFVYSARPHTGAALHEEEWGRVPYRRAVERLERLQRRQREICLENARARVGSIVDVLVEGPSRSDAGKLTGHTPWNHVVNWTGRARPGALARIRVETASPASLGGSESSFEPAPATGRTPTLRLPVLSH